MSRILRFLAIFCVTLFVGSAFAADAYTCDIPKKYISCEQGYYMTSSSTSYTWNESGSWCQKCSSLTPRAAHCPGGVDAPLYKVTLSMTGGTAGTVTAIYASKNKGWHTISGTKYTQITKLTASQLPTRVVDDSDEVPTTYTFNGFWTSASGGTQWIDKDGNFTSSTLYASESLPTILYAQWAAKTGCPAGQYIDGETCIACPVGTYSAGGEIYQCASCPAGTYTDKVGTAVCKGIAAGCYSADTGVSVSCPTKCAADTYSTGGATSCTPCTSGYSTNGATGGTSARACTITCAPGTIVTTPNAKCTTPTGTGWFTDKLQQVAQGDVSIVSYCPTGFSVAGISHNSQCTACVATSTGTAGKEYTSNPSIYQIKVTSTSSKPLALVEIKPYTLNVQTGEYTAVERLFERSNTGFTGGNGDDRTVVDGRYNREHFDEEVEYLATSTSGATYVIAINGSASINVDAIDVTFYGVSDSHVSYSIAIYDGTYTNIYATTSDSIPNGVLVTKRFIPVKATESPENYYAPARTVRLCRTNGSANLNAISCAGDTGDEYPYSDSGSDSDTDCYTTCTDTVTNGTAAAKSSTVHYGSGYCTYNVSCNAGYAARGGTDSVTDTTTGITWYTNPSCNAKCVNVTFDNGDIENQYIYTRYDDRTGWYSDDECTEPIGSIDVPGGDDWTFAGYWNQSQNSIITQDTAMIDNTTTGLLMILAPLPKGSSESKLDLDNFRYLAPGTLANPVGLYLHRAKNCAAGSGALCLGPYYNADEEYMYYLNCCLPGYNKAGMSVSSDGTNCPSGT